MVLQRDIPIHFWGWADPDEKVTVAMSNTTRETTADRLGHWSVYLPPQAASDRPANATITGKNTITLDDILIGDVWFASGQSNMEMPLKGFQGDGQIKNSAEEIRQATQPSIRLLFVPHKSSPYPLLDVEQSWTICTPETAATFSAVAYFFGREIAKSQHVPIGLIDSTWGGTPAEAWTSMDSLTADASLMPVFAGRAEALRLQAEAQAISAADKRDDEAARSANKPLPKHPWRPAPESWAPAGLYNAMVAPALNYAIKGVIWYQGEANAGMQRAPLYHRLFSTMISDWRKHWQQDNFPFLFVQLATYKADTPETWPLVREAQRRTLSLTNTGMAVSIDIGEVENIHPGNKQDVGLRLALAARSIAYREKVECSGPAFRQATFENGDARIWFMDGSGDPVAKGGNLSGFEIAGDDHHFAPGMARVDGKTIVVNSPQVARPQYVRYAWRNVPAVSLFNAAGLPASPFTSEETPTLPQ